MGSTKTKKKSSRQNGREFAPLTDKKLQAVKPRPKRYTLRDGRGLFLDVTPGGVRTWVFRYQFNGEQEKFVIGRCLRHHTGALLDRRLTGQRAHCAQVDQRSRQVTDGQAAAVSVFRGSLHGAPPGRCSVSNSRN